MYFLTQLNRIYRDIYINNTVMSIYIDVRLRTVIKGAPITPQCNVMEMISLLPWLKIRDLPTFREKKSESE